MYLETSHFPFYGNVSIALSHCIIYVVVCTMHPQIHVVCKVFHQLAGSEIPGFQPAFKPERVEKDMGHGQLGSEKPYVT